MDPTFIQAIEDEDFELALRILNSTDEVRAKRLLGAVGPLRVTPLQLAAWHGNVELLECLYDRGASLNAEDKLGRCALHHAVHRGHVEAVKWLLAHGASTESRFGILSCPRNEPYKCPAGPDLTRNEIGKKLPVPECWGRTALHQAVKNGSLELTELLLNAGADVNVRDDRGVTPLHLATVTADAKDSSSMRRFEMIVELLVSAKAVTTTVHPDTGTTALHHVVTLGSCAATKRLLDANASPTARCISEGITPLHIAASSGFVDTLSILLTKTEARSIDVRDHVGRTPLHAAAYGGHWTCVVILVEHGGSLASETQTRVTVIDAIFANIGRPVDRITDILDAQVRTKDKALTLTLDFGVLAPENELQMSVLSALIAALPSMVHTTILQHPLLEAFLQLKWSRIRNIFFMLVAFHLVFALALSANAIAILLNINDLHIFRRCVLFFCSFVLFCHNGMQLAISPRYCLRQWETWLAVTCTLVSLAVSIGEGVINREWLLHGTSVAILMAWIQMMLLVGRFPTWGYYALMFATVWSNVLKVLLAFVWLVIGFSLSFTVLFHGQEQFRDPWTSFVKTVVMMMGEYEYSDLFASPELAEAGPSPSFLRVTSRMVFLMFVMLASIVLMNLMIGLAVSDIQGLLHEGHIRRLLKQAEFVAHFERATSHKIFQKRWYCRRARLWLASKRTIPKRIIISSNARYGRDAKGISEEVTEALFALGVRNQDVEKKLEIDASLNNNETKSDDKVSGFHRWTGSLKHDVRTMDRARSAMKYSLRKTRTNMY